MKPLVTRILVVFGCLTLASTLTAGCEGDQPKRSAYGGGEGGMEAGGLGGAADGGATLPATSAGEAGVAAAPASGGAAGNGGAPPDVIPQGGAPAAGQAGQPSAGTGGEPTAGAPGNSACVGELQFPDPYFEQQVRDNLNLPTGPITAEAAAALTEFTLVGPDGAVDITGIECLTGLTKVNFGDNSVGEPLSLLAELPNLTTLDLSNDYLDDISELATLTRLKSLNLRKNDILDIGPLAELVNLESLDLFGNGGFSFQPVDLAPLEGMTKLKTLTLDYLIIDDLTPLTSLRSLEQLSLGHTTLTDPSPVLGIATLTSLNLQATKLSTLGDFSGLTQLTSLDVSNNQLTDISAVASLPQLTQLTVSYNPLTTLAPLVSGTSLGAGDTLFAEGLNCTTFASDFAALVTNGIDLHDSC